VGWSDPGPAPRGPKTVARELHSLLGSAKEKGPYVFVGHSWGGIIARVYASLYGKDVAGLVLVDPTHEDMYWEINGKIVVPRLLTDSEWAAIKPKGLSPHGERPVQTLSSPFDKLPSEMQTLRRCLMSAPVSESQIAGGVVRDIRQDLAEVYSLTRYKDGGYRAIGVPLTVLTKSPDRPGGLIGADKQKYNDQLESALARASRFGNHVIATTTVHHIQLAEPGLVIAAIRDTLAAAGKARTNPH
jgi:pimeloyl-ACP methyl ester carboxylesterase